MLSFTVVTRLELDSRPPAHATVAELNLAAKAGREAFAADQVRAPGANATVRSLIGEHAVGEPRTIELFQAFGLAYEECVDAAIAEAGL
jgi:hypothetical protein